MNSGYQLIDPYLLRIPLAVAKEDFVLPYVMAYELACQHCGQIHLARGFGEHLVVLRMDYGYPMTFNSACRCLVHNKDEGGHQNSAHICDEPTKHDVTGCCGVDVRNPDEKLITIAMRNGWSVGISYKDGRLNFAHLDRIADYSQSKDYQRLFFYPNTPEFAQKFWQEHFHAIQRINEMYSALSV